jgi:hypothetical protein
MFSVDLGKNETGCTATGVGQGIAGQSIAKSIRTRYHGDIISPGQSILGTIYCRDRASAVSPINIMFTELNNVCCIFMLFNILILHKKYNSDCDTLS